MSVKNSIALAILLFFLSILFGQNTVTIGLGNLSSNKFPVTLNFNNSYTQQIYPASDIITSGGSAGYIRSLAFQYMSSTPQTKNPVTIYLMNTTRNLLSPANWIPIDSMTEVFSGSITFTNTGTDNWVTIPMENDFFYDGTNNLAIAILNNNGTYTWGMGFPFKCHYVNSGKSIYYRVDNSPINPATGSFAGVVDTMRNNIQIVFSPNPMTCSRPVNLTIANVSLTAFTLSWTPAGTETSWQVNWKSASDTSWQSSGTVNNPNYVINGLTPTTTYNLRVKAICDGGNESNWTTMTFATPGAVIFILPYVQNFDSSGTLDYPVDWTRYTNYIDPYPSITSNYSFSSPNSLHFFSSSDYYSYAMAPPLDLSIPVSNTQLSFKAMIQNSASTYGTLDIGVMTDPADLSTFTVLESISHANFPAIGIWYDFTIPLSDYQGIGQYIAFRAPNGDINHLYVDNVTINYVDGCIRPINLTVNNITSSTANISWHSRGNEYMWDVIYGTNGFDITQANPITVFDTLNTLTNLLPNTQYQVYVRANCGGDTSDWSYPCSFTTSCDPITQLPWRDNMDSYGNGSSIFPGCWRRLTTQSNRPYVRNNYGYSSPASLYFYSTSTTYNIAILPDIDISIPFNQLQLDFWLYVQDVGNNIQVGIMTDPNDINSFDSLATFTPSNTNSWEEFEINLDSYSGTGQYIAFKSDRRAQNSDNTVYLDNVKLDFIPACPIPRNLVVDSVGTNAVSLSWMERGVATSWAIEFGETGFTTGLGATELAGTNPYILTGLIGNTTYDAYVKADCGTGEYSPQSDPLTFFMFEPITGTSHFETFEDYVPETRIATAAIAMGRTYWNTKDAVPDSVDDALITGEQYNEGAQSLKVNYQNDNVLLFTAATSGTHIAEFDMYVPSGNNGLVKFLSSFENATNNNSGLDINFQANGTAVINAGGSNIATFTYNQNQWFHTILAVNLDIDRAFLQVGNQFIYSWQWSIGASGNDDQNSFKGLELTQSTAGSNYFIDNIDYTANYPLCSRPDSVQFSNIENSSVEVVWTETGSATSWNIEYGPRGFPRGTGIIYSGITNPYTINGLTPNTLYDIYIQADCGNGGFSLWTDVAQSMTAQIPVTIPNIIDFEDSIDNEKWSLVNEVQTNKWYISSAVNHTIGGTKALYVSNTTGNTHAYNQTLSTNVWAYRDIYFTPTTGYYKIKWDWMNNGEECCDYYRMYLGDIAPVTAGSSDRPDNVIRIGDNYAAQATWQTDSVILDNSYSGQIKRLYFLWHNNSSNGTNPPAAIDNINISLISCPTPQNLNVNSITSTIASLSWNSGSMETNWIIQYDTAGFTLGDGNIIYTSDSLYDLTGLIPSTNYDLYLKADCGNEDESEWIMISFYTECAPLSSNDLPYSESFDSYGTGSSSHYPIPDCWQRSSTYDTDMPYISSRNYSSPGSLFFQTDNNSYTIAVMKAFDSYVNMDSLELSFRMRMNNLATNGFIIGVMTGSDDVATFFPVDTLYPTAVDTWQEFVVDLNQYHGSGRYIAFEIINGNYTVNMDNLSVNYIPSCSAPLNVVVTNITTTSADVSWNAGNNETSWELTYKALSDTTWISLPVSLNPLFSLSGLTDATQYEVRVKSVCSLSDESYWKYSQFTTECYATTILPISEDFDADELPLCWQQQLLTNEGIITVVPSSVHPVATPYSGNGMIFFNSYSFSAGTQTRLISLPLKTTDFTDIVVSYNWYTSTGLGVLGEGVLLQYSLDGVNWTDVGNLVQRYGMADEWINVGASLPDLVENQNLLLIGFLFTSQFGNNCLLDNFSIIGNIIPCDTPANISITEIGITTAKISWNSSEDENGWVLNYRTSSETNWSTLNPDTASVILTGLMPGTDYQICIKTICSATNQSEFGHIHSFTTLPQGAMFSITASTGENGIISPSGIIQVIPGESKTFTIIPNAEYVISEVLVDNVSQGDVATYTFDHVYANHTIFASFETGINENSDNKIAIYPNPVQQILNVKSNLSFENIEISNLLGQIIYTSAINDSHNLRIDVSELKQGIYFIRLKGESGIYAKKFIKE